MWIVVVVVLAAIVVIVNEGFKETKLWMHSKTKMKNSKSDNLNWQDENQAQAKLKVKGDFFPIFKIDWFNFPPENRLKSNSVS